MTRPGICIDCGQRWHYKPNKEGRGRCPECGGEIVDALVFDVDAACDPAGVIDVEHEDHELRLYR
jgi:PHP family Zn ribbon phosphoesterase